MGAQRQLGREGKGGADRQSWLPAPRSVASWPKELCVWWSPHNFTPPVPRVPKTLTSPTREPSLSTIPIPGRAQLSVSISMLGIRVHLMTNSTSSLWKSKMSFFSKKKNPNFSERAFESPSNGLEKGNGAITQLLLDPKSIFAPGNSCNILINPYKPASVHKQPASNRGSVTFESGSLSEV